jgi:hypothetical protein
MISDRKETGIKYLFYLTRSKIMNKSRLEPLAPLTGVVSVVLVIFGAIVISNYDYLPPAEKVADFLNNNPTRISTGAYLSSISAFFLIWFAGSLRSALILRESGTGRLSTVAFGGGVAAAVAMGTSFTAILSAGLRAGAPGGITPIGAVTMFDFWGQVMGQMFAISLAVLIGATAVISLRTTFFPMWFGWTSVLIAVGLQPPLRTLYFFPQWCGWLWSVSGCI